MSDKISLLQPDKSPLIVLTKKLATETCSNYRYDWFEDDLMARWAAFTGTTETGTFGTTLAVDDSSMFAVDDLLKVPTTGEVIKVETIVGATSITVTRAYGSTAAANLVNGAKLLCMGPAIMQGAGAPAEKYNNETPGYNYSQIFRTSFSTTGTLNAIKLYGGKQLARLRMKKGIEHAVSMEYSFLFGERKLDITGAQPRTTTAGVLNFLSGTTNVTSKSKATVVEADLDAWCEKLFTYGSSKRTVMCSPSFITWINSIVKNRNGFTVQNDASTYGIKVYTYETPHGTLNLVKHPLLVNAYDGYGIALDMEELKYRPLTGRDTSLKTNIQNNDEDGTKDEYLTEAGLELRAPKKHGMFILTA